MSAAATVIIPTYGQAPFLRQALASAQNQTVSDLEICVICDGSPPEMVDQIKEFARGDERVKVFTFAKSPRTGEPHRHAVLGRTSAPVVCYLCHDDLWFPHHVAAIIRSLERFDFVHTLHTETGLGTKRFIPLSFQYADLQSDEYRRAMVDPNHPAITSAYPAGPTPAKPMSVCRKAGPPLRRVSGPIFICGASL